MSEERLLTSQVKEEDTFLDTSLRPQRLPDYIGQTTVKENLQIFLEAARKRAAPLEHVLLYGPPGLGKTTLAHIIAREMGASIRITSGPAIERAGDLAAILTNLQEGDILFIDEIHRLHTIVEEILYPAMEDYVIDIVMGKGPAAKTIRLDLPHFTLIGATTRISLLSSPLRDRFGNVYHLDFYQTEEIHQILRRSARILGIDLESSAAERLARCSRATPRVANRLLKRVRDYAEVRGNGLVNLPTIEQALAMLQVDQHGLDLIDRRILQTIIEKFSGGPVGISTIAAATAEERETIEEVYEPFLLQQGFLARTSRGRVATELAYKHLSIAVPNHFQQKLRQM